MSNQVTQPEALGMDMPLVFTVGAVGSILILSVIVATHAWFSHQVELEREEKSLGQVNRALVDLKGKQHLMISRYAWVDKEKGVTAIPIDRAMELMVAEKNRSGQGHE